MKNLLLFLVGAALGLSLVEIPFKYWFLEYGLVKDVLTSFAHHTRNTTEDVMWFVYQMLVTLPFFVILGCVCGAITAYFCQHNQRAFIYGFLLNFVLWFLLPHIPFEPIATLVATAAPKVPYASRFSEVIFSNLYFLLSFFAMSKLVLKFKRVDQH